MSTHTTKDGSNTTVTFQELAAQSAFVGSGPIALTVATPLKINLISGGVRCIQDEKGTYVLHPSA